MRGSTSSSWTLWAVLQHSTIRTVEHDMKKNHFNIPGYITHDCMALTRTAYTSEGQFWHTDVALVIWPPSPLAEREAPWSSCRKTPQERKGCYYRGYSFSNSMAFRKEPEANLFTQTKKSGPTILPSSILICHSCPWISLSSIQLWKGIEMSSTVWSFQMIMSCCIFIFCWSGLIFWQYLWLSIWQKSLMAYHLNHFCKTSSMTLTTLALAVLCKCRVTHTAL